MVKQGSCGFGKKEDLLLLISPLRRRPFESCVPECRNDIERACKFMEGHCAERICLEQICRRAGLAAVGTVLTLAGLFLSESKLLVKKEEKRDGPAK